MNLKIKRLLSKVCGEQYIGISVFFQIPLMVSIIDFHKSRQPDQYSERAKKETEMRNKPR